MVLYTHRLHVWTFLVVWQRSSGHSLFSVKPVRFRIQFASTDPDFTVAELPEKSIGLDITLPDDYPSATCVIQVVAPALGPEVCR